MAYRYLNGGSLTPAEQKGYQPTYSAADEVYGDDSGDNSQAQSAASSAEGTEPPGPADLWLKARNRYAPVQPEIHSAHEYGMVYSAGSILAGSYENCQEDGFHVAIATLERRSKIWGPNSPELAEWIKGQDAVFSNCGSGSSVVNDPSSKPAIIPSSPAAAPASAPQLLQQDRA